MESNKCAKYLKSLISLGIVKKEFPITGTASKKSIYLLDDMMFRFWYRFVFPNMSAIVSGLGHSIYQFNVAANLNAYMGLVFEEICRQYLFEEAKRNHLPFFIGKAGRWWGGNPKEKRQEEIDILAYHKDSALFCECKWTNSSIDIDVLCALSEKTKLFGFKNVWLWLFSKTGFTKRLVNEAAKHENIRLIRYEEM
jgi:hypothetical protein